MKNNLPFQKPTQTLLTPIEVAKLLGVTVETLNVWRCTHRYNLSYVKIGSLDDNKGPGYAQATIVSTNYDSNEIVIDVKNDDIKKFAADNMIRIYNKMRSAIFEIEKADFYGSQLRLRLDRNALMARFPITKAHDGLLELGASTSFARNHKKSYMMENYYRGCWVGYGETAEMIKGIVVSGQMHFVKYLSQEKLEKYYVGKVLSVWHYGAGDKVEVALVSSE